MIPLHPLKKWPFVLSSLLIPGWATWQVQVQAQPQLQPQSRPTMRRPPDGEAQAARRRVLATYKPSWQVAEVVFSPDGKRLAVHLLDPAQETRAASYQHHLEVRDVETGQLLTQCDVPGQLASSIESLVWSPDGSRLISTLKSREAGDGADEHFCLVAWDSRSGHIVKSVPFPELPPLSLPSALSISDQKEAQWVAPRPQPENPKTLTVLPDGRLASRGRSVALFDLNTLALQGRFLVGGGEGALDFDPQHKLFATVKNGSLYSHLFADSQVQLWNADTLQPVRTLPGDYVRGAKWSPVTGELAVWQGACANMPFNRTGNLSLWNADGSQENWKAPFDDACQFDWSPTQPRFALYRAAFTDSQRGVIGSDMHQSFKLRSSSLEWWNSETRTSVWTRPLSGMLEMMQISPDGRAVYGLENRLYSTSTPQWNCSIWVWDTQTGHVRLHRNIQKGIRLQWAPQGARLALSDTGGNALEVFDLSK